VPRKEGRRRGVNIRYIIAKLSLDDYLSFTSVRFEQGVAEWQRLSPDQSFAQCYTDPPLNSQRPCSKLHTAFRLYLCGD
jgi:hypothetical protein